MSLIDELKDPARRTRRQKALERRARKVREEGEERLWSVQTRALERVGTWLQGVPAVPVLQPLADAAERLVDKRLTSLKTPPIEDYDALNAKNAIAAIRGVDSRVALRVVREREVETKNRKTVLRAIDERLEALAARPEPPEAVES